MKQTLTEKNLLNPTLIHDNIEYMANEIVNVNARKWFVSQLYKYITNRHPYYFYYNLYNLYREPFILDMLGIEWNPDDWRDIPTDNEINTISKFSLKEKREISLKVFNRLKDNPNVPRYVITALQNRQSLAVPTHWEEDAEDVKDYLNHISREQPNRTYNMRWEDALLKSAEWHLEMQNAQKDRELTAKENELEKIGTTVVFTFPNKFKVLELHSSECLDIEGQRMGHCVGGYSNVVDSGETKIYSLRDPNNKPVATIEYNIKLAVIRQIKGTKNYPPNKKYVSLILKFLTFLIQKYDCDFTITGISDLNKMGFSYNDVTKTFITNNKVTENQQSQTVWQNHEFKIKINNAHNLVVELHNNIDQIVGSIYTSVVVNIDGKNYLNIAASMIAKPYQGMGLGLQMYKALLSNLPSDIDGIASFIPDRNNKKQVPAIYKKLNGYIPDDNPYYYVIDKLINHHNLI